MTQAPIDQPATPAAEPSTTVQPQEQTVPYSRFKEINEQLAALKKDKDAREEADRKAAEQKAQEQGEWETIAKQRESEIGDLKPKAKRVETLEARLHERVDRETKDWPKEVKDLIPDAATDPIAREAQVEKLRPLVAKLTESRPNGTPRGPRGTGESHVLPNADDLLDQKRRQVGGL